MVDETSRHATIQKLRKVQTHLHQLHRMPLLAPVAEQLSQTFSLLEDRLSEAELSSELVHAVDAIAKGLEQLAEDVELKPATALTYLTQLQNRLGGLPDQSSEEPPPGSPRQDEDSAGKAQQHDGPGGDKDE